MGNLKFFFAQIHVELPNGRDVAQIYKITAVAERKGLARKLALHVAQNAALRKISVESVEYEYMFCYLYIPYSGRTHAYLAVFVGYPQVFSLTLAYNGRARRRALQKNCCKKRA